MSLRTKDHADRSAAIERDLIERAAGSARLCLVEAPPGSGKTRLLTRVACRLVDRPARLRIAIACQTNSQADDVCRKLSELRPPVPPIRFVSKSSGDPDVPDAVQVVDSGRALPSGPALVVGTSAKWSLIDVHEPFDLLMVDEGWQLAHKDFLALAQVAERFVLIGDPGQIPPVVAAPSERWSGVAQAPHRPAPEVLRAIPEAGAVALQLPSTWRLPADSAELVQGFYDFGFDAVAEPGERVVRTARSGRGALDGAIDALSRASVLAVTLPTPDGGPPLEADPELAARCALLVERLLARGAIYVEAGREHEIAPCDVGLAATHRRMVTALEHALPARLRREVRVDTPERWQGLERRVLIAVHPLSGVLHPSEFDLETGRLCVMASRHRGAVVIATRDHVGRTLEETIPCARQPLGVEDVAGRGHAQHTRLWKELVRRGQVLAS